MSLTDHDEENILRYLFGRRPFVPPPIYYAGLSSTPIGENATGATEPSGGGYERIAVPNIEGVGFNFSAGQITNGTQIAFPTSTGPWGEQNYIFFSDQPTAGTVRMRGSLSPSQTIDTNQKFYLDPGDLVITLD